MVGSSTSATKTEIEKENQMTKLSLLSVVLLIATSFAQTKTAPAADLHTWNVTNDGKFTIQYDAAIWKEVTDPDAVGKDEFAKTVLVPTDGTAFVVISGVTGNSPDRTFKETTTAYVDGIKENRSDLLLGIAGETVDTDDKGVFVAYIQEPPDGQHPAFVVNDWIFNGNKNDVSSHSGILIEGLYPAAEVNGTWNDRMEAVVKTLKRNAVPKAK
jgi:hypothetical protein